MKKRFPIVPARPERICWGCDKYCAADQMMCGNGSVRTPHPSELFGEDWEVFGLNGTPLESDSANTPAATAIGDH
jgi:hypothetical protein